MSKTIWTALHAAKQELGKVPKDATNPFFKSKYFDINGLLDVVEPVLHKNGLFVIQPIIDGKVTTKIVHGETGESIASEMQLSDNKDPQKQGSEITYYRRYTLQSLLAMQADDDDGNAASKRTPPAAKPAASTVKADYIDLLQRHHGLFDETEMKQRMSVADKNDETIAKAMKKVQGEIETRLAAIYKQEEEKNNA